MSRVEGVIPAHVTPMRGDGSIDWDALDAHVGWLAGVPGVRWITTTAHASEVATLDDDERQAVIGRVSAALGPGQGVVAGVYEDSSSRAAAQAVRAVEAGADALLVFPSGVFAGGGPMRPATHIAHYAAIAEAVDVPLIAFKYPRSSPLSIPNPTLVEIIDRIPSVVAIKEWSYDIVEYEDTYRLFKQRTPEVAILTSFSRSLLASLVVGSDGILSGHGSVVADLQSVMSAAVRDGDLAAAQAAWDRVHPLAVACYADPFLDQHNRMKTVLGLIGRIPMTSTSVRAPLCPLDEAEIEVLREACRAAGLSA